MPSLTRRELLKTSLVASAGIVATGPLCTYDVEASAVTQHSPDDSSHSDEWRDQVDSPRERLLMDFGWRFHLGNAADHRKDFDFGAPAREGTFAKASFVAPVT